MYEWIDPFEQQARAQSAERRASSAYEDGQRSLLRAISKDGQEQFTKNLTMAVQHIAFEVAKDHLRPHMAQNFADFQRREQQATELADAFWRQSKVEVDAVLANGEMEVNAERHYGRSDQTMTVSYEVRKPFRVNRAFRF